MENEKDTGFERKYWLWVADPRSWLDEHGNDAKELDPGREFDPKNDWWTCNRDVLEGGLAFLWRTKRGTGSRSDIGYLMEVRSEAYIPEDFKSRKQESWEYWCRYKSIYKFANPVTIDDFKGVQCLEDWGVYKAHFQRHAYEIPEEQWKMLNQIATQKNPDYGDFMKRILEQTPTEKVEQKDTKTGMTYKDLGFKSPGEMFCAYVDETAKHVNSMDAGESSPEGLNVDDFRLPEELVIYKKIKDHPGVKKLEVLFPETFQEQGQVETGLQKKLIKEGVKITKASRPDIIETLEKSFSMFGYKKQQFEVFTQQNLSPSDNATVFIEDGVAIFLFMHDILKTFTQNEIKSVIGHELGHLLLGHTLRNEELLRVGLALSKAKELGILNNHPDLLDLILYVNVTLDNEGNIDHLGGLLPQLEELSADRIGLLVSRDLQSSITGFVKIAGGFFSDKIDIKEFIEQAKKTPPEADDVKDDLRQTHPYPPHRSWALQFFSETDLFKKAIGLQGGEPISKFSEILPKIIPFPEDETIRPSLIEDAPLKIQDYTFELFFYNDVAWADGKFTPSETNVITQFVPSGLRDEVFQKWKDLNDDWESKSDESFEDVRKRYFAEACQKDSRWKTKIIKRMIKVARAGKGRDEKLNEVLRISEAVDAQKECSRQFLKEFGYRPFV